jgi:hypothetical protein
MRDGTNSLPVSDLAHGTKVTTMIKRIRPAPAATARPDPEWLNLDSGVEVELTSEDPEQPIEGALSEGTGGWRAATSGPQTITLIWAVPVSLQRIRLVFEEQSRARTQEFVLRASTRDGDREIVRQQFTFSPPHTTLEREEYNVSLNGVTRLQLEIVPAIDGGSAVATLKEWRAA